MNFQERQDLSNAFFKAQEPILANIKRLENAISHLLGAAQRTLLDDNPQFQEIKAALTQGNIKPFQDLVEVLAQSRQTAAFDEVLMRTIGYKQREIAARYNPTMKSNRDDAGFMPVPPHMVYQICKVVNLHEADMFVDLGSGPGTTAMAVALFTGARGIGVEYQQTLVEYGRGLIARTNLPVELHHQDAATYDFSKGNVFYLFNPFKGETYDRVISQINEQALRRPITLVAFPALNLHFELQSGLQHESVVGLFHVYRSKCN